MKKEIKFLYIGDIHERLNPPENRIDNWQETLDNKAKEILNIAKKNKVSAILQGGDFGDTPKFDSEYQKVILSRWAQSKIYNIIQEMATNEIDEKEVYEALKNEIPMIGIAGNHDEFGNSMKSFSRTSLSLFSSIGFIRLATKENPVIFKGKDFSVGITGSNYDIDMDKDVNHKDYLVEEKKGDYHIHLVHGMAMDQSFGTLFDHTNIHQLGDTCADLTITAHNHDGYDPVVVNGKIFVNPGAITRLTNSKQDIEHVVKVMLITISKEKGIQLKMIPLKSAKPASEVLSVENKVQKVLNQERVEKIKNVIDTVHTSNNISILDIVNDIAKEDSVSETIREDIKSRISEKMAKEPSRLLINSDPYFIEKIELTNFEAHEHTIIQCNKNLNVIIGETDKGKSSIIRALQFIYGEVTNAARDFIRYGQKEATASITLSNGYIIERCIEAKVNGFNGYRVFYPKEQEWVKTNTKETPIIQQILGYSQMVLDDKTHFSINFLEQSNDWFFIGKSTAPSLRAKIIGTVYKTHYGDMVLRDLETAIKKGTNELALKNKDYESYRKQFACMKHVEPLEHHIALLEAKMKELDELQTNVAQIQKFKIEKQKIERKLQNLNGFLDKSNTTQQLQKIEIIKAEMLLKNSLIKGFTEFKQVGMMSEKLHSYLLNTDNSNKAKEKIDVLLSQLNNKSCLEETYQELKQIREKGTGYKDYLKDTKQILLYQKKEADLISLLQTKENFVNIYKQMKKISLYHSKLNTFLKDSSSWSDYKKSLEEIKTKKEELQKVEAERKSFALITTEGLAIGKDIKNIVEEFNILQKEYSDYLEKIDICPVCLQKLSKEAIHEMVHSH